MARLGFPVPGLRSEGSLNLHLLVVHQVGRASAGREPQPESLAAAHTKGEEAPTATEEVEASLGALSTLWGKHLEAGKKHPEPNLAIVFLQQGRGAQAPRWGRGRSSRMR